MIITCKACSTSFNLDDKIIKPTGSKVRCSVCANVFTVFPEKAASTDVQEGQIEPEAAPGKTQAGNQQDNTSLHTPAVAPVKEADADVSEIDDAVSKVLDESFEDLDLDLDIDDFDDADGEDEGATMIADLDNLDLDLPLDEPAETQGADETILVDLDSEDLDLDLDIPVDADDDADDADDSVTMVISDIDEDDDDGDAELVLEEDQGAKEVTDEEEELELDFETEGDASSVETSDSARVDDQEDELLLDLDEGFDEEKEKASASAVEDDIDLSSLEEMFDDKEDDAATVVVGDDDLSGMALELDEEPSGGAPAESKALDEALPKQNVEDADDSEDEIDLSEIEKMLEEPPAGGQKISVPEQDLDLDVEASLESEKWMESGNNQLVADEELDLTELEQALEDVDSGSEEEADEDQELDLDLSEDADLAKAAETVAIDKDLDFDLSDFEDHSSAEKSTGTSSRKPAEMKLEFEVEESPGDQSYGEESLDETVVMATNTNLEEGTNVETTAEPVIASAAASAPKKGKKKSKKSLVFLLILLILGGAAYGVYYLSQSGVEIPFIGEYLNPKPKDTAGTLKLSTFDINSRFIDNSNLGKLFVITGKVRNGYDDNRGMVSIKGKILAADKQALKQEMVYCGNIMSDLELANLEWDKIQARLANRLGDNRSNVKIEPRKSIPFMVVFSGLPDNIEEFTIEVTGSTSLK